MAGSDGYCVRRLQAEDYNKGFMQLLGQLTVAGDVSEVQFTQRFQEMFVRL